MGTVIGIDHRDTRSRKECCILITRNHFRPFILRARRPYRIVREHRSVAVLLHLIEWHIIVRALYHLVRFFFQCEKCADLFRGQLFEFRVDAVIRRKCLFRLRRLCLKGCLRRSRKIRGGRLHMLFRSAAGCEHKAQHCSKNSSIFQSFIHRFLFSLSPFFSFTGFHFRMFFP